MNRSDDELLASFADLTLPSQDFDHLAHLRVAWACLQRYPLAVAVERVCDGIRAFAAHVGAPARYHRTLTEALVRIMSARPAADPELGWEGFLARNPDLVHDARGLVLRHYSDERLASAAARAAFVAPDREPLPAPWERPR
ncbi:hypothetical protein WME91_33935 [Sorangium sp. So ce269]